MPWKYEKVDMLLREHKGSLLLDVQFVQEKVVDEKFTT